MKNNYSTTQALSFGWTTFKTNWKFWVIVFILVFGTSSASSGGSNTSSKESLTPAMEKISAMYIANQVSTSNVLGVQNAALDMPLNSANTSPMPEYLPALLTKYLPLLVIAVPYLVVAFIGILFFTLLGIAVNTVLQMGFIHLSLDAVRGNPLDYKTLLSDVSVRKAIRLLFLSIVVFFLVLLGLIFFIIPGIYLAIRYMFASQLLVDKNLSISEALKQSSNLTKGVKLQLLGTTLVIILVIIIGLVAFVIGIVPAIIVAQLALAYIYVTLEKQQNTVPTENVAA